MDLQKVEDKVLPRSRKPPTSKIAGGERLKMETLIRILKKYVKNCPKYTLNSPEIEVKGK